MIREFFQKRRAAREEGEIEVKATKKADEDALLKLLEDRIFCNECKFERPRDWLCGNPASRVIKEELSAYSASGSIERRECKDVNHDNNCQLFKAKGR